MKLNKLTAEEEEIIMCEGTESLFSGKYDDFVEGRGNFRRNYVSSVHQTEHFPPSGRPDQI